VKQRNEQASPSPCARIYFVTALRRICWKEGPICPTVQALLGHADLKPTSIYLHMSERHLKAAGTPLDKVELSSLEQVKRSRKLHKR
jgi:hypothetical protein